MEAKGAEARARQAAAAAAEEDIKRLEQALRESQACMLCKKRLAFGRACHVVAGNYSPGALVSHGMSIRSRDKLHACCTFPSNALQAACDRAAKEANAAGERGAKLQRELAEQVLARVAIDL